MTQTSFLGRAGIDRSPVGSILKGFLKGKNWNPKSFAARLLRRSIRRISNDMYTIMNVRAHSHPGAAHFQGAALEGRIRPH
eukprot:1183709-Prorocentrum_minimum.AAC.1